MSSSDHTDDMTPAERDSVTAGEHVLGLLEGADRAAVERRLREDPGFASEVRRWEAGLADWLEEIGPQAPPPHVWDQLQQAVRAEPRASSGGGSVLDRLWVWRAATGASLALAASLAVVVATRPAPSVQPEPTPAAPQLHRAAVLNGEDGKPAFVAILEPNGVEVTALAPLTVEADRALELWLVPVDGVPRSLGLIAPARKTSVKLPEALRPHAGTAVALAVSVEPPGGAPGGQATGPLIAQGELSRS